jgi:hypothetical protein
MTLHGYSNSRNRKFFSSLPTFLTATFPDKVALLLFRTWHRKRRNVKKIGYTISTNLRIRVCSDNFTRLENQKWLVISPNSVSRFRILLVGLEQMSATYRGLISATIRKTRHGSWSSSCLRNRRVLLGRVGGVT